MLPGADNLVESNDKCNSKALVDSSLNMHSPDVNESASIKESLNESESCMEEQSAKKAPSMDFTSHFLIRKNIHSSEDFKAPQVSRPFTAQPSLSYLKGSPDGTAEGEVCSNHFIESRPSTATPRARTQHPFMKAIGGVPPNSGRLSGESPRTKLLVVPESPMDSTYQPLYMYCLRKCESDKAKIQRAKGDSKDIEPGSTSINSFTNILQVCGQKYPIPIDVIFNGTQDVEKIGEGVYGEVYAGTFRYIDQLSWVYKVVPIQGSVMINGEKQKTFKEVLPEIVVSQLVLCLLCLFVARESYSYNLHNLPLFRELSKLRTGFKGSYTNGFVHLRNARVAKGKYSKVLLDSWDKFNDKYGIHNELTVGLCKIITINYLSLKLYDNSYFFVERQIQTMKGQTFSILNNFMQSSSLSLVVETLNHCSLQMLAKRYALCSKWLISWVWGSARWNSSTEISIVRKRNPTIKKNSKRNEIISNS